jgi:hypothetical protein
MTTAENLRKRFREFAAENFGCGVVNPANLSEKCEHAFRHDGHHSWDLPAIKVLSSLESENAERLGTWTMVNGLWCVRASGTRRAPRKPGDVVRVQSKDGKLTTVRLGEKVSAGIFTYHPTYADDLSECDRDAV